MSDTIVLSPEAKLEAFRKSKIEASVRLQARKKEAILKLIAMAERVGNEEEKAAAKYLNPGRHIVLAPKPVDIFGKEKSIHEDILFKAHKLGRAEMRKMMKKDPTITFNTTTGIYTKA